MGLFHRKNFIVSLVLIIVFVNCSIVYGNPNDRENVKISYRFAGDHNYPPYEYVDNEGNIKGFNVDIINAIAQAKNIEIEIQLMEWNDAVLALDKGQVDGLIGMSQNKERLDMYNFSTPTVVNNQVIFVRSETVHINELLDLAGMTVAYQKNDINEPILNEVQGINILPMEKQEDTLLALSRGEVDAAVGNEIVGIYHIQRHGIADEIKIVGEPLVSTSYGPAVKMENTQLNQVLEEGLQIIKENKVYDQIYDKWFGTDVSIKKLILEKYRNESLIIAFTILLIFILQFLQSRRLERQVQKRTKELELANKDLIKQQNEIYNLAYFDSTTSLPNRLYFVEELDNIFENIEKRENRFGILFLDLDKFKHINDTLGHNVGDHILKLFGMRLNKLVEGNGIVAKGGGDEYYILLDNLKEDYDAMEIAHKIIEDFKKPYYIKDLELYLTTSIGIALYPDSGLDPHTILKNADLALYKAKDKGGNSYYLYGEEIESKGFETMILLNQLRQAILNDELVLHYQPQIDLETEKIIGLEALVRWNHPEKGLLYPDKFIPIAEETGLIIEIGEWVLKNATKQAKEWIDKGHDIVISINISPRQFQHDGFIKDVVDSLTESGLDPCKLTLEITETTAISDIEHTLVALRMIKSFGASVAIDDFGTGYSSLSYLNEMSVNELKIDRSFIWDIEKNTKNKMISNTIILLGKQLGLKVVAEGIENTEQLQILKELNCDLAQGYHFCKPVPKEEIEKLLNQESFNSI